MIRAARLPEDEPAILSFIWSLQTFENAFEPNRRLDPDFVAEHWADVRRQPRSVVRFSSPKRMAGRWAGRSWWKMRAICSCAKASAATVLSRSCLSKKRRAALDMAGH